VAARYQAYITGIGVTAPNGWGVNVFWRSILSARSGIRPITRFPADELPCRIAGEVAELKDDPQTPSPSRADRLLFHAARLALADAHLGPPFIPDSEAIPVIAATSTLAPETVQARWGGGQDPASVPPPTACLATEHLARLPGVRARLVTLSGGWTAGLEAVRLAADWVAGGRCEVALAGATEAPLTPAVVRRYAAAGWLTRRNDTPERVPRPFDIERDGWVPAEGAAVLVVESEASAWARQAEPYAAIAGSGSSPAGMGDPAAGLAEAMGRALADASCRREAVNHVSAWACGDPERDAAEAAAIHRAFGFHAPRLAVTSIKGAVGNCFAAGAVLQAAAAALSLHEGRIPPTANLETPDPDCRLDCVTGRPRRVAVSAAVINALDPAGDCFSLLLQKPEAA